MGCLPAFQEDRYKSLNSRVGFVEMVVDELAFPQHAPSLARLLAPLHASAVRFRTDEQDEISLLDLQIHPYRPPVRRGRRVLVDHGIHALLPQPICQAEDAVLVFGRVVAVADEHSGRAWL
jgi:hypothetical protein